MSDYECDEFLEVPLMAFNEAIEIYKEKYGNSFDYNGYHFSFETSDSLKIKKIGS